MKTIYVFGIRINTNINDEILGCATAKVDCDDRVIYLITQHISSDESWCRYDMGVDSKLQHNIYDELFPEGYKIEWVGCFDSNRSAYEYFINNKSECVK